MHAAADILGERRATADALVSALVQSSDPVVAHRAGQVAGIAPTSAQARAVRARIAGSPMARALLRIFEQDEKTLAHTYRKWQGPHWTLTSLAMIGYPPGDETLLPLVHRVYGWLLSSHFLRPPLTAIYAGEDQRVRHCASMDGNAIRYSVRLGLEGDRTRALVDRLIGWQWPDGGWNCDKRPQVRTSSFQESLIPARGLWAYGRAHQHQPSLDAAQRVAELVLSRRLLWRRGDGSPIKPKWGGRVDRIHYPIQFYDVLFALEVMADLGRLDDPRCADALALLASKQLPDGGFPLEEPNAPRADRVASRHSYADWGPTGLRRSNPLVSLAALGVLRARAD
ncbi:hypothetical protein SAMN04515671_3878 [Nakamurella panacisegetis]|uniref:Prenyltransferase and squalene oxidase repeat-containing protein n=1 Tax=Nakamurella panacisegetis TaxID=1090615 RepID=A0A1H0S2H0_9ACTN|nr:hypothetical protein [Nakamurella panacisegetis]SDP36041.1 hypothetical protein SAMN04515671_3878 [Nakamurella panacisegetis]